MLCRYGQNRHAFMPCGNHAGNEVRRTRPRISENSSDLPSCFVQPFRHMNSGGFMAHGDESDAVLLELREHRIDFGARQTENEVDSFVGQTFDEKLTAADFGHHSPSYLF